MSKKLWQGGKSKLHPLVEAYTVGQDYIYDNALVPYDIEASTAHAKMLGKIGILSPGELKKLESTLSGLVKIWEKGDFIIELEDEDCHTAIENYLLEKCGDLGKKIHTGRSRNDQVLVAMHLYMKDELLAVQDALKGLLKSLKAFKERYGKQIMPGYTHMQRAMPMNVAMLVDAYMASLEDDLKLTKPVYDLIDQNPLGSAAGFGVPKLKLDRAYTSKLLGFKKTMNPPLYCQNSRAKLASLLLSSLSQIMMSLDKIASDMLLFTTQEFNFFSVNENMCTGSSIMPQKRNLDLLEILRANTSLVFSYEFRLKSLGKSLISGYHRDLQLSKEAIMESFSICFSSLEVLALFFANLKPNKEALNAAMSEHLFATEKVYDLLEKGMSFRDAYMEVKKNIT